MLVDPGSLFQKLPSAPPLLRGTRTLTPRLPDLNQRDFQADSLQLSPVPGWEKPSLTSTEDEVLPRDLVKETVVTKLLFGLKAPLSLFHRHDPDQIVNTGRKDVHGNPIRLTREAAAGLDKIYAITRRQGITVRVVSSYRSVQQQQYLWDKALKKYGSAAAARKWVAPPGKSRHNSGQAVDLYMYRQGKQISQKEFDQITAQADMYRPMSWETWHVEPVSTRKNRGI